jgi:hypothetical protein
VEYLGQEPASALPYGGRYPSAYLVHNGVWYYGTYCLTTRDKGLNWDVLGPFVGFRTSTDYGKTWRDCPHTPENPLFGEPKEFKGPVRIGAPHFVDCGKNMEHSPDGKAYLVAHGALIPDPKPRPQANASWITGDAVYLLRVSPSVRNINDASKYEFFAGHDDQKQPLWTQDLNRIKPLADWNNHMGCVTMTYNAPLKKYFMCATDGGNTMDRYDSYIMESDNITGPWRMVTYMERFGMYGYFVNIPSKFISADGQTAWLCYSTNWAGRWRKNPDFYCPPGGACAMTLMEFTLMPADTVWKTTAKQRVPNASKPHPADGEVVSTNVKQLKWTSGINVKAHRVYFGAEIKADDYFTVQGDVSTFDLPALKKDTVYKWRVDEVQRDGSIVAGRKWSFTTSGKLMGWWKLDDSSETIAEDSSGNGFDGKVTQWKAEGREGGWVKGKIGGATNFDGGDSIEVPAKLFESIDELVTIAFWVNAGDRQPRRDSIFEGRNSRNERILNLHLPWEYGEVHFDAGQLPNVSSYPRKYDKVRVTKMAKPEEYSGRWNHWAVTKNAYTGEMRLYLNGNLWHSGSGRTQSIRGITRFNIGSYAGAIRGEFGRFYYGIIDNFRIYNYEMGPDEIKALYDATNLPEPK